MLKNFPSQKSNHIIHTLLVLIGNTLTLKRKLYHFVRVFMTSVMFLHLQLRDDAVNRKDEKSERHQTCTSWIISCTNKTPS